MFATMLKKKKKESIFFQKNGAAILEQMVISFNGNCNLNRSYSIEELNKATNNFALERIIHKDIDLTVYKAVHEDRQVLVKKFFKQTPVLPSWSDLGAIANEVAIASQMSKHNNVLKLLECCLDTKLPMLVYEFPENGNLVDYCGCRARKALIPWETKLRIATQIANAVAYLHHGFSNTIIHRYLGPSRIFLDQDYVAKLSEFRISVPIPEGKTHVDTDVIGTCGYMAPEVALKGRLTERSDVYAFGVLLCVFLTAKSLREMTSSLYPYNDDEFKGRRIDGQFRYDSEKNYTWTDFLMHNCRAELRANVLQQGNEKQVMECCKLIERCLGVNIEDRPDMIEVAKALRIIKNIK